MVRTVDVQLVRAASSQHQFALRMCEKVAQSLSIEWCHDIQGDSLLETIRFPLHTAVAVPVAPAGTVEFVILFLSARMEQVQLVFIHS